MKKTSCLIIWLLTFYQLSNSQTHEIKYIPAQIDFSDLLQQWDGFGFNYVETAQTRDYNSKQQDYGGFSLMNENQKNEIADLIFGNNGLQVQIIKMFLDPYHQDSPNSAFDHNKTTRNMQYFVKKGIEYTKNRNDSLQIISTLYGPPAWSTLQKFIGARDIDSSQIENLCIYMLDWVKFLQKNNFPIKYFSLHNEGEDFYRWEHQLATQRVEGFDYNMYWSPKQVNHFLKLLPKMFDQYGVHNVKVTNGEPSNWTRFYLWGYAHELYNDNEALQSLGLLTTHGFVNGNYEKLSYSTANSLTIDLMQKKRPDLHTWITSFSWGKMDLGFMRTIHEHIYTSKVNALIPWAGIQNPSQWLEGDPNPGTAIKVNDNGTYEIQKGYYLFKQLTRAGSRGMYVANAYLANPVAHIIAFSGKNIGKPDAFVLTSNISVWGLPIEIEIKGTQSTKFKAYRTKVDGSELFKEIGEFEINKNKIIYDPPTGTVTTFIAIN